MNRAVTVALLVLVALALWAYGRPAAPVLVRASAVEPPQTAEARGRIVYELYGCRMCHGEHGQGEVANPNAMSAGEIPSVIIDYAGEGYTTAELERIILDGVARIDREDDEGPVPPYRMPGWRGQMSGQELDDLIQYLMSLYPASAK